jgi:Tfp pilus assembly protein PilV
VRPRTVRERFLREEGGFTLIEMMVTTLIMIVVLMSLYSIFDMSVRVFMVGNNKTEAVESARLGLEKMEREIRAAYPVDASAAATNYLFFNATGASPPAGAAMPTSTRITFGNELVAESDPNKRTILCGTPCEYITYKLTDDTTNTTCTAFPCTLRRINAANSSAALTSSDQYAVVENVAPDGLTFTYLKSDGTAATTPGEIATVLVSLEVTVDQGNPDYDATQRLTTEIDLRNRE